MEFNPEGIPQQLSVPVRIEKIDKVAGISVGDFHTCAWLNDGSAWCWGQKLGVISYDREKNSDYNEVPVKVIEFEKVTGVASARGHSCAWLKTGKVACWGWNNSGQLGDGTKNRMSNPVLLKELNGVVGVTLSENCSFAWLKDGSAWGWGIKCLPGIEASEQFRPIKIKGIAGVVGLAAGDAHFCAWTKNGSAWCWGYNISGQLGDGTRKSRQRLERVRGVKAVVGMAVGMEHTCAWQKDGSGYCWGRNDLGELGNGKSAGLIEDALPCFETLPVKITRLRGQ